MSLRWRSAGEHDLEAVISLIRQDSRTPERAGIERLRAAFHAMDARADSDLIVGELDGRVVATYQIFLIEAVSLSAPLRAQLEDIRVDANLRGQGIGAALMADAEARAKAAGASLVQLLSNRSRVETHRFYEAQGYTASHFGFKKRV